MEVLFVYRYFYPCMGGTEKQGISLASSLAQKGISIRVITSRFEKSWPKRENIGGVKIVRLPSPQIKFLGAFIFVLSFTWYLFKIRNDFSVIQTVQINYVNPFSILIGLMLNKPTILKLASSGVGGDINKWKGNPFGRIFIGLAKKATLIIAMSERIINELRVAGFSPTKVRMIGNGVDLAIYKKVRERDEICKKLGLGVKEKNIIYTGRLSPEKGVDFLIRAFSRLKKAVPLKLLIVGEGEEKNSLKNLVKQLGIDDSVVFVSNGYDIKEYLQIADLFVLPSRYEGLSNSLLEAMACELPIISTRVSGSIDLIKDGRNGLLIGVGNEKQLITAVEKVFRNPELASTLGKNARKTVEKYCNLEIIAEEYIKLYKELKRGELKNI